MSHCTQENGVAVKYASVIEYHLLGTKNHFVRNTKTEPESDGYDRSYCRALKPKKTFSVSAKYSCSVRFRFGFQEQQLYICT